jgi:CRP-like cAMP-binding protein
MSLDGGQPHEAQPDDERSRLRRVLAQSGPFHGLPPEVMDALAAGFQPRAAPAGTVVCRQGEPGDELFLIESGELETTAAVGLGVASLGTMGPGEVFGEIAVLMGGRRTATVTAQSDARLWVLPRARLAEVGRHLPPLRAALQALMRRRELPARMHTMQ